MEKEINKELEKTLNYLQEEIIPNLKRQIQERQEIINKAIYWIDEYCIKLCDEADVISELRVVKDILRGDE